MEKKGFMARLLERRVLVIILVIAIFITGGFCYYQLPKQHFPAVVIPFATVTVIYPGATAEDIEELVAEKVEHVCMQLDGYDRCETIAADNYCLTSVSLNMDLSQEEIDSVFNGLRNDMEDLQAELPSGITSISVNDDSMETAGVLIALTGDNISTDELSQRSKELCDKLRLVEGVNKVEVYGDVPSEVKITVNIDKLNDTNVSLAELSQIIAYHNSVLPTGSMKINGNDIKVTTSGRFDSIEDIKNIVVSANDDYVITKLSDIADIRMEVPDDEGYYIYNDGRSTVIGVYFQDGLNVVSVGDEINEIIDSYDTALPDGIGVHKIFMQPDQVQKSINNFILNLLESIVIVILVILVGMNFRNAVVISIAIPLAIVSSFISLKFFGYEIQFVSLASLIVVLGMLVDNAVVVSDAIQKNIDAGMGRKEAVVKGTSGVAVPVFVSMLTTATAFASILTLPGSYKQLSVTFPIVIISCLVASYIISICVTPVMSYYFLKKTQVKENAKKPLSVRIYDWAFSHAFKHKRLTIIFALCGLVILGSAVLLLDTQIAPPANDTVITIDVTANKENSLERTREIVDEIEDILDEQEETQYYLSGIGAAIPRYDFAVLPKTSSDNTADIFVRIDLDSSKRFKKTCDMVDFLQTELETRIGGADIMVDELPIMAIEVKPVEMKIYSDSTEDLNTAATLINNMMGEIEGTKGIKNVSELATYNYYVDMDELKLNSMGLMEAEVQNELYIALQGSTVSTYKKGNKEYDIVLDSNIDSREQLKAFKVKASTAGTKYSVSQFADVGLTPEITSISRIDGRRGREVYCYNNSRISEMTIQTELEKMIEENADSFPESVEIEKSGKKDTYMNEVMPNIAVAFAIALAVILLILIMQFGSFKKVFISLISYPFGLAAGAFGLLITGQPMSLFALVGAVSLLGCVLSNAIVLMDCISNEQALGLDIESACKSAGGQRLRPIMMSTMTTVLGLLPLALFGDEMFVPMAVLMLVGLFAAMLTNLVLVPLVYYLAFRNAPN